MSNFYPHLHHHYPTSTILNIWSLKGGASAQMTAVELRHTDGSTQKVIVRQPNVADLAENPAYLNNEFRLLKHLQTQGIPVQTPYLLDETRTLLPTPYMIVQYIEGNPDFNPHDLDGYIRQFAHQLAQIHQLDPAHPDLAFLPTQTDLVERLVNRAAQADPTSLEGRIFAALQSFGEVPTTAPAFLHGDFWHGNLLWKDGHLQAVIDWEDAHIGNPLLDFAICRLDWTLIFGFEAMETFTRDYQDITALDVSHLAYWDLLGALRAAPMVEDWALMYPHFGRPDITRQTMRERHGLFVERVLKM
jgi:aminoglycoside phosphotransferase (APT) family kinase protein